jgi:hypothetical protein
MGNKPVPATRSRFREQPVVTAGLLFVMPRAPGGYLLG